MQMAPGSSRMRGAKAITVGAISEIHGPAVEGVSCSMKGLGDVFALGPRVEPRPKAVTQGKGLEHAFGKIGPACRCGSEICGDGLEGGLMMVIDRRMQWEEDSIFWLDRAYFLNSFNEGLVYGLHNCLRAETQGPESFGG